MPFDTVLHQKSMEHHENIAAELLREVQEKAAAFKDAYNRCTERRGGTLQECLQPVASKYREVLNAFSDLILNGRYKKEQGPRDASRTNS